MLNIIRALRQHLLLRRRVRRHMSRQRAYKDYSIGRFTYGSPSVHFPNKKSRLIVGQFCSFADQVKIFLGGEHRTDWLSTYPFSVMRPVAFNISGHPATKGDVVIGNDVWIGHGAVILSGVTIGDGAVIGAHAVVARDVAAYTVASGNPARAIRQRFAPNHIQALLEIRWWDWPLDKIDAEIPLLLSGSIDEFIARHLPATLNN
jgi:acetyltransferase-like isoleucine patch superfamily enzyme